MSRLYVIAALGVVIAAAAIGLNYFPFGEQTPRAPQLSVAGKAAPGSKLTSNKPSPPSFSVVRVNPQGDSVIAGRAEPGCRVEILDDGKPIGSAMADANGEWVFVPRTPLRPGSRRLSLLMHLGDFDPIPSESVVVLAVPERSADTAGWLIKTQSRAPALQAPRTKNGLSAVFQKPSADGKSFKLLINTLDYSNSDNLIVSGHAMPGAVIQLYLDNRLVGQARSADSGVWRLAADWSAEISRSTLRADQVDSDGKVLARASFFFSNFEPTLDPKSGAFVVIQPGHSLWRLARKAYGAGFRYTVIYQANKDQIRDPDMIFPGQVLALPR